MTGGWKQKSGWIQILSASCVPFTFPFVGKQGERGEAKLSTRQIRLETR